MHSKDLVNWELAGYCMDRLDLGPAYRLEGGNIYGRGIWAPCIRYHDGMFYVFSNVNGAGLQVFRSKSIQRSLGAQPVARTGTTCRSSSMTTGKIYIISGGGSPYPIEELAPDLRSFVPGVRHQLTVPQGQRMGEGHHLYKIKGKYYDVSAIPGGAVDQMVARADSIDGPWTVDDHGRGRIAGRDRRGALRAPTPTTAACGCTRAACATPPRANGGASSCRTTAAPAAWSPWSPSLGTTISRSSACRAISAKRPIPGSSPTPATRRNPSRRSSTTTTSTAASSIRSGSGTMFPMTPSGPSPKSPACCACIPCPPAISINARNSLCQRPPGPESIMTVELDTSGLVAGDTAGLALLSTPYAWIGVVKTAEGTTLQMFDSAGGGGGRRGGAAAAAGQYRRPSARPIPQAPVVARALQLRHRPGHLQLERRRQGIHAAGQTLHHDLPVDDLPRRASRPVQLQHSGQPGGYADFDNYTVEEPRARGIEREIPMGKTITLTSGADGSFLAADTQNNVAGQCRGRCGRGTTPQNTRFQVIDLGKGRVALKAANGRFVSAAEDGVVLKDLAGQSPGDAESFQWVNLMRGDTMLMSLTNHRYLATKPNNPGPVTVTATGPRPARKGGAEFKWKAVE